MPSERKDHYATMGLSKDADIATVRKQYKKLGSRPCVSMSLTVAADFGHSLALPPRPYNWLNRRVSEDSRRIRHPRESRIEIEV